MAVQIGEDTAGQSTALPNGEINPRGQAVSNTMALMHDPGTASSGRYAIDVDGVESRIFVKSDGSHWVWLWREDEATVDAQITLPQARDATLYLPTTGREPVGTLSGMSAFTVTVGPDPVLVQPR